MIDIDAYNKAEEAAIAEYPNEYEKHRWKVDEVDKWRNQNDFPLRVKDISEIGPYLNRFQRDRYDAYIRELGGITLAEFQGLAFAGKTLETLFPDADCPIDTVMSAIASLRKVSTFMNRPFSVLEIGPGIGANSLLFHYNPTIVNYTQVETTQSLYLLQSLINDTVYKDNVWDGYDNSEPRADCCLWHLPWWRVQDLTKLPVQYDVFIANAVLAEITTEAFNDYLTLMEDKAHEDSILLVQCPGGYVERPVSSVLSRLMNTTGWYLMARSHEPVFTFMFSRSKVDKVLFLPDCYGYLKNRGQLTIEDIHNYKKL